MKIFNYIVTTGAWDGVSTPQAITILGKVQGGFETYVFGPIRFTKIPEKATKAIALKDVRSVSKDLFCKKDDLLNIVEQTEDGILCYLEGDNPYNTFIVYFDEIKII